MKTEKEIVAACIETLTTTYLRKNEIQSKLGEVWRWVTENNDDKLPPNYEMLNDIEEELTRLFTHIDRLHFLMEKDLNEAFEYVINTCGEDNLPWGKPLHQGNSS